MLSGKDPIVCIELILAIAAAAVFLCSLLLPPITG